MSPKEPPAGQSSMAGGAPSPLAEAESILLSTTGQWSIGSVSLMYQPASQRCFSPAQVSAIGCCSRRLCGCVRRTFVTFADNCVDYMNDICVIDPLIGAGSTNGWLLAQEPSCACIATMVDYSIHFFILCALCTPLAWIVEAHECGRMSLIHQLECYLQIVRHYAYSLMNLEWIMCEPSARIPILCGIRERSFELNEAHYGLFRESS